MHYTNFSIHIKYGLAGLLAVLFYSTTKAQDFFLDICEEQPRFLFDHVAKNKIATVQLHPKGKPLSYPIILLAGTEILELSFDELTDEIHDYAYTFVHCNANGKPSDWDIYEYTSGFTEGNISDYEHSFNTQTDYVHYKAEFPNEDIQITQAGNYILYVYEDFDVENPVLTKRFYVIDPKVEIVAEAKRSSLPQQQEYSQEIRLSVKHKGITINNPAADTRVFIMQNFYPQQSIIIEQPVFIGSNELRYDGSHQAIFGGLKEHRYFDCKSARYISERVADLNYDKTHTQFTIINEQARRFSPYLFNEDLNGKYAIHKQEAFENATEADYVNVAFNMPYPSKIDKGSFYIVGALSGYMPTERTKMKFDNQSQSFKANLLLKQGYYNYLIGFSGNGITLDFTDIEGDSYETENDYLIIFYHQALGERVQKPIGYKIVNSVARW